MNNLKFYIIGGIIIMSFFIICFVLSIIHKKSKSKKQNNSSLDKITDKNIDQLIKKNNQYYLSIDEQLNQLVLHNCQNKQQYYLDDPDLLIEIASKNTIFMDKNSKKIKYDVENNKKQIYVDGPLTKEENQKIIQLKNMMANFSFKWAKNKFNFS